MLTSSYGGCLFAVNVKTMARIDAKRSGITKDNSGSVLRGLKSPILVLSGRYREISGFSFAADGHLVSGTCLGSSTERFRQNAVDGAP